MRRLRSLLVVSFALLPAPLFGQSADDFARLKARLQELEVENSSLKQAFARKEAGSLGVPHGRIVTIEGDYDRNIPPKSLHNYRVTSVDGQRLAADVHVFTTVSEWAAKGTADKRDRRKLRGFTCPGPVGDPFGRTGLVFHIAEMFVIIEVVDAQQ